MKKKPNHLADYTDKTSIDTFALSGRLGDTYQRLQQATLEIRQILSEWQPDSILNQLHVVGIQDGMLTLSVKSHTAANHLHYQQHHLINIINEHVNNHSHSQTFTFKQLSSLKFLVVNLDHS